MQQEAGKCPYLKKLTRAIPQAPGLRSQRPKVKETIENKDLNPNLQHHQAVQAELLETGCPVRGTDKLLVYYRL